MSFKTRRPKLLAYLADVAAEASVRKTTTAHERLAAVVQILQEDLVLLGFEAVPSAAEMAVGAVVRKAEGAARWLFGDLLRR